MILFSMLIQLWHPHDTEKIEQASPFLTIIILSDFSPKRNTIIATMSYIFKNKQAGGNDGRRDPLIPAAVLCGFISESRRSHWMTTGSAVKEYFVQTASSR